MKFSLHALTSQNSALHCQTLWNGRHRCSSVEGLMAASLGSTTKCDHIWGWVKTYYRMGLMWCCTSINQSILGYDAIVLTHSHVNIGMNMIVSNMCIYIYTHIFTDISKFMCAIVYVYRNIDQQTWFYSVSMSDWFNMKKYICAGVSQPLLRGSWVLPVGPPLFMGQYS